MKLFTAIDLVDEQPGLITVRASISALTSEAGGRLSALFSGYRPNHNFGAPADREFYIGAIEFFDSDRLPLGETGEATVTFLTGRGLKECLEVGREWRIQEAGRLVATGKILEILDDDR